MKRPRAALLGVPAILLAWLPSLCDLATAAATCYGLDGAPFTKIRADDGDWVPCDPSASVSSCCSVKDYCMGNGLCLDAGANNYFSIQGCTDAAWGKPCVTAPSCVNNIRDKYSFVWPCGQVTNSTYNYCCGPSPSCCSDTSSLLVIPAVTSMTRPAPTTETPTTATATATITVAAASGSSGPDGKILAIGLGAGLGTGLVLLAAILLWLVYQLRRKSRQGAGSGSIGARGTSSRLVLGDAEDKDRNQDPAPATSMYDLPVPGPADPARTMNQQQPYVQNPVHSYEPARYPELASHNQTGYEGYYGGPDQQMSRNTSPGAAGGGWYGGASPNSHP